MSVTFPLRRRWRLYILSLVASMSAAFVCAGNPLAASYIDLRDIDPIRDADAAAGKEKSAVCVACHGDNGASAVPLFPSLRGQTTEYLYWQLVDFKRGVVPQPIMQPLVAPLSDQDLRDVAAFYAQVGHQPLTTPVPAAAAEAESIAQGERLYLNGDAARGIPPCQGCHGQEGRGHPLITQATARAPASYRTYPALRAQQADYLVTKLTEYRDGKLANSTNDFIMTGVARHLDDASMRAIAAWLSTRPAD